MRVSTPKTTMQGMHMMDGIEGMGGMGGMMLWMLVWGLVGLALLALTVVGIVWLIRRGDGTNRVSPPESAGEILSRRYAAGELDEDEYLRRRAGLQD